MPGTSDRERARDPAEGRRRRSAARRGAALPVVHFHRPTERPFTASQRESTTILIGGLSPRHDKLVEAAIQAMGCRCQALPNVTMESYTAGREFGNNGLCNPTYFTVGNLVKFLQDREAEGMSKEAIVDTYVFLTAGSCGTCRFGMYESQYRLALENAGFHGFRVVLFGTDDGIDQSSGEAAGLDLSLDFFLGLITAFDLADVLNQYTYRLRPYEVVPGSVDEVTSRVVAHLYELVRNRDRFELEDHWTRLAVGTRLEGAVRYIAKILHLTRSDQFTGAMREARDAYDQLEFDPFRVRPVVKVMGEFWAQTTEGPGNFHIHRFLEQEGAEVYVDRSLFTRLSYMLFMHREKTRDRRGLRQDEGRLAHYLRYYRKMGLLGLADRLLHRENRRLIEALGGTLHEMLDQSELELLARPYWNWRTTSGEGHLEIAENIYYHTHHLCHMVLSLKPFTCMPSTQSDGVQVRVVEDHPGMIFLPIETSGDGEVIAHSRVQMALGSARAKARKEMDDIVAASPWTLDEIKEWADDHPHVKRPSYRVPHAPGVVGRAANLALHISGLMGARTPARPVTREAHRV
ncbi:MAG: activator of (R)-2-hydroxyglutaryl-CoA dehydratase [Gemmatimonadetes bacterium]|nr:activator of (R)-2-hydroxyglutaryl-CoA dehydratase [Gemmatimonadota bacterium]